MPSDHNNDGPPPTPPPPPPDDWVVGGFIPPEELDKLSTLQLVDLVKARLDFMGVPSGDHQLLRQRVEEMEEIQDQAREALEKLSQALDKLRSPALRIGTYLDTREDDTACVVVSGSDYVCNIDPSINPGELRAGMRVTLNEAFAITSIIDLDVNGPVMKVSEVLADGRLRLGQENGLADLLVTRSPAMKELEIKSGAEVRLDTAQRVAMEVLGNSRRVERSLMQLPKTPWEAVGGQEEAVAAIRDAVEMPYLHGELFATFQHPVPKGFLLYGPPGCGKTLLGRATAYNLRQKIKEKDGVDRPDFFLHVKGPEILNMWLGESERQVRDLFAQCREKAAEGHLAFLFIDEAESVLGTRNGGRIGSTILNTLVPMFCTEMDGLEALKSVVIILASNRADLIDPAILRPGRIDRKIRVARPDHAGVEAIYRIYLDQDIPLDRPAHKLARKIAAKHFDRGEKSRFLEVTYRSGKTDYLYFGDLASGALVESIVERAKELAIQRSIDEGAISPLKLADLEKALAKEYQENELFPPSDLTEDWLKLTDFEPGNVVKLQPYRTRREVAPVGSTI